MSVGAVGGAGGAGGAVMGGVGAAGAAGSVRSAGGGEAITSTQGSPSQNGKADNSSEASAGVAPQMQVESNFSTQDFLSLRQTSMCQGMDSDMQGAPDLKKLLEWIIALKLLEQMGKQQ